MVEIRKLRPLGRNSRRLPVASERPQRRTKSPGRVVVVTRRRVDYPPPTPLDTPCVLWQGSVGPDGYGRRKVFDPINLSWRTVSMHRWVMEQMEGRPLKSSEAVMHRCDNRLCYRVDHLQIGSVALNNLDMFIKGRASPPPVNRLGGATNPNARLDVEAVAEIRAMLAEGFTQALIARQFGVSTSQIQRIAAGRAWKDDDEQPPDPDVAGCDPGP